MVKASKKLQNDREKTELPHYAVNKFLPADSYFTSKATADKCFKMLCDNIDIKNHTLIEPSAGSGVFYDLMPKDNRIGVELYDRRSCFIRHDYLTWYPKDNFRKYIVLGNPPFGVRGAYALAFINRSLLFSEYVAFILPMSFASMGKGSNMRRVQNGHLIFSRELSQEGFYSPDNNKEICINVVFQIWKRGDGESLFTDYDLSNFVDIYTVSTAKKRKCGLDKIGKYDFYVASSFFGDKSSTAYKFDDVQYGSGYGIIIKKNKKEIMDKIKTINWNDYAHLATNNCKHISKHSIEKCLFDLGIGEVKKKTESVNLVNKDNGRKKKYKIVFSDEVKDIFSGI
jgi:hypothetical protein